MVIIQMKGGLGNQLFQYALYRQLRSLGRNVKMDDATGFRDDMQRDPALLALGLTYERASQEEIIKITDSYMDLASRIRRKLTGRRTSRYDEKDGNFDPYVLKTEDAYLVGYWQSEKYFPDPEVRRQLKDEILAALSRCAAKDGGMEGEGQSGQGPTVSLHIRRGDYLAPGTVQTFGGICTDEYYEKAVRLILGKYPGARFIVFSNDREYAAHFCESKERIFGSGSFVPARGSRAGEGAGEDALTADAAQLYGMAQCDHHILANSSFSWWGAWLGTGMKIVPGRWLNNKNAEDIYTDDMLRIGADSL